jgi:hypothetical protein
MTKKKEHVKIVQKKRGKGYGQGKFQKKHTVYKQTRQKSKKTYDKEQEHDKEPRHESF